MGLPQVKHKPVTWRDLVANKDQIRRAWQWFSFLPQPDGLNAGKPFKLGKFQRAIIAAAVARDKNGERIVNTILVTVPRKNGKSTLVGGIATLFVYGPEAIAGAQNYCIAFDKGQASVVHNLIDGMVMMTPDLKKISNSAKSIKKITNERNRSFMQALSSEARSHHGKSTRLLVIDELHAFGRDDEMVSVMRTSTGAYDKEALTFIIGTQSPDDNSIMSQEVDYAQGVIDGTIEDPHYAAFIWAAPDDADIWDEDVWLECNPAIEEGFRSLYEMRQFAAKAKRMGGSLVNRFRNLYLNQRISAESSFINREAWESCGGQIPEEVMEDLVMRRCWGGLDLSRKRDLTSLVLAFEPTSDDPRIWMLVWCWMPGKGLVERSEKEKVPYNEWAEKGYIEAPKGDKIIKYGFVAKRLMKLMELYNIQYVGFDRWRIDEFNVDLEDQGFDHDEHEEFMVPIGQGYKDMSPCVEVVENVVEEKALRHGDNPVLSYAVSSAVVVTDPSNNRKFVKNKSIGRIDPLVAASMALRVMELDGVLDDEDRGPSIYETEEPMVLGGNKSRDETDTSSKVEEVAEAEVLVLGGKKVKKEIEKPAVSKLKGYTDPFSDDIE